MKRRVDVPGAKETFERWLARGDAIGVFENRDLASLSLGHSIFIPLTSEEQGRVEVNKTKAPDGPHGRGWRYLLQAVEIEIDAFEFVEDRGG
jgi:hypothetical protein